MEETQYPVLNNSGLYAVPAPDKSRYYFLHVLFSRRHTEQLLGPQPDFNYWNYFSTLGIDGGYPGNYTYNAVYIQLFKETAATPALPGNLSPAGNFWFRQGETKGKAEAELILLGNKKIDIEGISFEQRCGPGLRGLYFTWGETVFRMENAVKEFANIFEKNGGALLEKVYTPTAIHNSFDELLNMHELRTAGKYREQTSRNLADFPSLQAKVYDAYKLPAGLSYYQFALQQGKNLKRFYTPEQIL